MIKTQQGEDGVGLWSRRGGSWPEYRPRHCHLHFGSGLWKLLHQHNSSFFLLAFTLDPLSEVEEMHYLFWCFYILKHFFLTLRLINHLSVVLLFNINETMSLVSQQSSIIFWSNCVTFVEIMLVLDEKHIWCTKCAKFLSFTQSRKTDNLLQTCFLSIDPQLKRPVAFPPFYRFITLFTQFEQKHSIVNAPPYWGIIKLKDNS